MAHAMDQELMTRSHGDPVGQPILLQVRGGYGETEVLWAEEVAVGHFRILVPAVYAYGISPGTIVAGIQADHRVRMTEILQRSDGGTIRLVTRRGLRASDFFLTVVTDEASEHGLRLGPATALDPRLVAVFVHDFSAVEASLLNYVGRLEERGDVTAWEISDPDPGPPPDTESSTSRSAVELVHPPLTGDAVARVSPG